MGAKMDAESLILAVLMALPSGRVLGKKRLQKLAYFAAETGADADVKFFLHGYGPFSAQIASAADLLSFVGAIKEETVRLKPSPFFSTLYQLSDAKEVREELPQASANAIRELDNFSTVELEIASTLSFFMKRGKAPEEAEKLTAQLKPGKATNPTMKRAEEALSRIGLYERRRADKVPDTRPY